MKSLRMNRRSYPILAWTDIQLSETWTRNLVCASRFESFDAFRKTLSNVGARAAIVKLPAPVLPEQLLDLGVPIAILVEESQKLPAIWLRFSAEPITSVMYVPPLRPIFTDELNEWLAAQWINPASLVDRLLTERPSLDPALDIVTAVLESPLSVRRPRDVAARLGRTKPHILRAARKAGFYRVEHILTYVRWRAHAFLVKERGMLSSHAHRLLGIKDSTNFRRQVKRAWVSWG